MRGRRRLLAGIPLVASWAAFPISGFDRHRCCVDRFFAPDRCSASILLLFQKHKGCNKNYLDSGITSEVFWQFSIRFFGGGGIMEVGSNVNPAAAQPGLQHKILGSDLQYVEITLAPGEEVVGEPGAMMYMDEDIVQNTVLGDGSSVGFLTRIWRSFPAPCSPGNPCSAWFTVIRFL